MKTLSTKKTTFIIPTIIISLMILLTSSCSCSKSLEGKCILKEPKYQEFVKTHNLENDINDFLSGN
jgi:hypothetical protein